MSLIYLGNLPMTADEQDLRQFLVEKQRTATKVDLKRKAATGKSRGFAFIEFESDDEAAAAIQALNGAEFAGRVLKASGAKPLKSASHESSYDEPREQPRRRSGGRR